MLHDHPPADFRPAFTAVSCLVTRDGRWLLLRRTAAVAHPGTWGAPTGKVHPGESLAQAMCRELREETGLALGPEVPGPAYGRAWAVRYPEVDFAYHLFHLAWPPHATVRLEPREHDAFRWCSPEEARALPLVPDMDGVLAWVAQAAFVP